MICSKHLLLGKCVFLSNSEKIRNCKLINKVICTRLPSVEFAKGHCDGHCVAATELNRCLCEGSKCFKDKMATGTNFICLSIFGIV